MEKATVFVVYLDLILEPKYRQQFEKIRQNLLNIENEQRIKKGGIRLRTRVGNQEVIKYILNDYFKNQSLIELGKEQNV